MLLTANVFFTVPAGVGVVGVPGTVTAFTGSIAGDGDDLTISFPLVLVNLGNGTRFSVDINDVAFDTRETLFLNATVKLLAEPSAVVAVPEPTSLALWGLGAVAAAVVAARRRRAKR